MAFVINDRVKETTTTTGTGAFALGGAVQGFETFGAGIGNSNTTYYAIFNPGTAEFEVGLGTLDGDSSDLARTTVISSSNSDNAVNFTAGTKDIFCTLPASKAVVEDASNDASIGNNLTIGSQLRMPDNTAGKILVGDGTSFQEVAVSGDATLSSSGALTVFGINASLVKWQSVKTSDFTAKSFEGYWVDTSSAAVTVTLPSSPNVGDMVVIGDYASNFNTNECVVALNGSKLKGTTVNGKLATQGQTTALVYADSTKGWLVSSSGLTSEIIQPAFISASGGTETTSGNFKYHAFTSSGTFTVSSLGNSDGGSTIEYLVVGGGGSGGTGSYAIGAQSNGGAGGAGGTVNNTSFTVSAQAYTITIGAGGAGVAPQNNAGNDGNNTTAFGATGGYGHNNSGMSGGASGAPQSNAGGGRSTYAGGGGGGAGGAGAAPSGNTRASGGVGLQYSNFSQFGAEAETSPTQTPTANGFFAGGGQGGGAFGSSARAAGGGGAGYLDTDDSAGRMAGVPNTGGGGAGGYAEGQRSGNGGSGVVLVRYRFQ